MKWRGKLEAEYHIRRALRRTLVSPMLQLVLTVVLITGFGVIGVVEDMGGPRNAVSMLERLGQDWSGGTSGHVLLTGPPAVRPGCVPPGPVFLIRHAPRPAPYTCGRVRDLAASSTP